MKEILGKFKFKDKGTIINAPEELSTEISELGFNDSLNKDKKNENTLVFIYSKSDFIGFLQNQLLLIRPDSVLWFAYQKGTSKIKTDINRDIIRNLGEEYGITTVTAISVNDTWSALRFRPIDQVGKQSNNQGK